jgi:four helix bundle protein
MGAKTFEELISWQLSAQLRDRVVAVCATVEFNGTGDLRDQLQNAAASAPALIAEGFGRYTHRDFARYLTMARSEILEVQNHLGDLAARGLTDAATVAEIRHLSFRALVATTRLRSSL